MSVHKQQKLPYLHIGREKKLPSSQVHNLVVTSNNGVWMATPSGLCHYDGIRVSTYTKEHGLSTHGLRTVYLGINEKLFIGTDAGLDKKVEGKFEFTHVVEPEKWNHGFIECLLELADGTLFIGTANGLYKQTSEPLVLIQSGFIQQIIQTNDGSLWVVGKPFGLLKVELNATQSETITLFSKLENIKSACIDPENSNYLFLGGKFGIHLFDIYTQQTTVLIPSINDRKITAICSYKDEIWIGTDNGLFVLNALGEIEEYSHRQLHCVKEKIIVTDIKADAVGNVWVSTQKNGAYKFSFMRDFCIEYEHDICESVYAIRKNNNKDEQAYDYLLASQNGLFGYNELSGIITLDGLSEFNEIIWDVLASESGVIWLASQSGLYQYKPHYGLQEVGKGHPVCQAPNRCLLESENLSVYVGTQNGLAFIDHDGSIGEIKDSQNNGIGYVYTLEKSTNNNFYIGTLGNGLWYGNVLGVQRHKSANISSRANIYSIAKHSNGTLAILCDKQVVLKESNGQERVLYEYTSPVIGWTVKWHDADHIWVGTSAGLIEINVHSGSILLKVTSLPGGDVWEFNSSRSLAVGEQGEIFCGISGNFSVVKTQQLRNISKRPLIGLKKITWVNASNFKINDNHIKEGKWTVQFAFDTSWSLDEENLEFQYKLVGFDRDWSQLSKVKGISFNSLPLGIYQLLVQAHSPLFGYGDVSSLYELEVSAHSKLDSLFAKTVKPIFSFTQYIKNIWRNLSLNNAENQSSSILNEKMIQAEEDKLVLQRENLELKKHSTIDSLTKIANRRAFDAFLDTALDQAHRHKLNIALILLDVDNFKLFNDTYGHIAGDDALKKIAGETSSVMRKSGDLFARYGGEEFAVVMPLTNLLSAEGLAKRMFKGMQRASIAFPENKPESQLTVSMGIVSANFSGDYLISARDLINQADNNLYKAKAEGKNRFISSQLT